MRKIYLIISFIMFAVFQAQIVNIPDPVFKARLLSANTTNGVASNSSNQYMVIDTNGDQEIQVSEALNVAKLFIPGQTGSMITDLTGINQFANLTSLSVFGNALTNLQISGLSNLIVIHAANNNLTTVSVDNLSSLQNLNITNNHLTSFSVTNTPNLQTLSCSGNQLTSVDISNFPNLMTLECNNNLITSLILNNNNILTNISATNNKITAISLDEAPNVANLYINDNLFTTIDAGSLIYLDNFNFSNNPNLINFNIKNGKNNYAQGATPIFSNTPSLSYICADDFEKAMIGALINWYNQPNVVINSYCSFTPGGNFYTIQGSTKYDVNNNGCDVNDPAKAFQKFVITNTANSGNIITNASGNYLIPVQAGNHTITPVLENPTYFTISPTSVTASFPAQTSPLTQNFCLSANGAHNDLEVVIIPITVARPGFDAKYKIIYKNKGTTTQSGTLSFNYNDNLMNYLTASMNPSSQSNGVLSWNFTNLAPLEQKEVTVSFTLNTPTQTPPLTAGDTLHYTAQVNAGTDETPLDNTFTLNQTVVNSFDPNDKTCLEGTTISQAKVGDYVHYMIRFENTGTANAQNIVVKDDIDASKYDLASLVSLAGSHNFVTRITGNTVEFIFENIQLPFDDANNDGYVSFKIKTKSTLNIGDSFSNKAEIYFDYNAPIITNNFTTTVQNTLSALEIDKENNTVSIYPNPVKDVLNIQSKNEITKAEIFDAAGRILISTSAKGNSINVSEFAKGNYIIKLSTKDKTFIHKFIKN
ncbi:conserved repeat domain-containing protein/Por secretion system C-terminal sorting domain-containing protein [Chryseobacterium taichungense]|uniref:Conserved repeat domain-containing protein/Por secretion system C-terminal sorting domain-containing protein n=1 Tax=Chryseobacterium taichungense TaxID=295069 RepID=A0A1H7YRX0_9FLAO|nr:T9SS type A sorting domain-containing protein [Chryseobacterium taichungense]SEM48038.1 conserved repeat domain-containing protein/Por secretion system C-terminal sorting domain-containing protein [Chryseobacterium taichungense]